MPRASSSAKRQHQAATSSTASTTNRDARHENGLVGPGKRIPKHQKSLAQLSASATSPKSPPLPLDEHVPADRGPTPASPAALNNNAPGPSTSAASDAAANMAAAACPPENHARRASLGSFTESESSESYNATLGAAHAETDDNHRRIDVNATKNSNVHRDPGPLEFALTVLRSCPLQDTIAILIILMQIPPVALSAIYMLFTLLTFVTTSSGLSLSDVFEWNLGAPSVATVVCVDGIVLLIWLFLWGPIQHVILDLAQMVIALGLGGGSSSRDGGSMKNSLICLSMILLSHALRHTRMRYSPIGYLLGSSRFMTPDIDDPLESLDSIRGYDKIQTGWVNWVRSVLAIHILTQGLVKYIRDWYLRRERRDSLAQTVDPEAGKPFAGDISNDGGFSTPDSDAASLQPQNNANTKKKRKQSAQIRNRQPLWAAIASTKIVVVKEYELTHNAADSAGANATDIHNLGNAPFNTQSGQIWISYVGCDEVCFNTSHFSIRSDFQGQSNEAASAAAAAASVTAPTTTAAATATGAAATAARSATAGGIDVTKPFYVRVNNAVWQPTRIASVDKGGEADGRTETRWCGDIYGLTPTSNYECEFVSTTTHEVLFATSVRTTQPKTADVDVATSRPNGQRSLRPDSPSMTLKTSNAAAEVKLAEEKARQKTLRKEWHRKTNGLKKENEKLSAAVQSAGTGDDKLRQKVQQNTTQHKQAEQAISKLESELKELETIPESLRASWKAKQSAFNSEKSKFDKAHSGFKTFKASIDSQVKALADDKASLEAKRNKISSRIAKVDGEHARITDANARGLDEAERRRQDRVTLENNIGKWERELLERLNTAEARLMEKESTINSLRLQLEAFHGQQQSVAFYPGTFDYESAGAGPLHAGPVVGSAPYDPATAWTNSPYGASLWGPSPLAPGFVPQSSPLSQLPSSAKKSRGRSSSMLSDVSGFTQSSSNEEGADIAVMEPTQLGGFGAFRPPPGFGYPPQLKADGDVASVDSESASGSGTSLSSGSESAGDPISPGPTVT